MGGETVARFGKGGLLRGFVNCFFQKLQDKGLFDDSVAIAQPIEKRMCSVLEQQGCEYNLLLRSVDNGQVVDEHTHVDTISRCVNPCENFESYMKLAENPDFCFIVSNTTKVGTEYVDSNQFVGTPARSFPGKLTQPLYKRFRLGLEGFIILSYELVNRNREELEKCCLHYADLQGLEEEFKT